MDVGGGIVTLLFTDLVDSTGLIERLGDDTAEPLSRRHFAILRAAVADCGGREVKSTGDGVMATFPSALAALKAAARMQRSVAAEPGERLGLRVGVHAGEPIADGDDYFGQAVVVAKRLCDAAGAGEVWVSGLVRGLVGGRGGLTFRELGAQRLKGIVEPVPAYALTWNDNGAEQPAPGTAAQPVEAGVEIQLCGSLKVAIDGGPVEDDLPGRKGKLLFGFLVLHRDRAIRREELVGALWPDDPPVSPDRALATVLARLRAALGGELIQGRAEVTLALPPSTRIDVEDARRAVGEAEAARTAGHAGRALQLAGEALAVIDRPLLPGLEASWIDDARRDLDELGLRALEVVAAAGIATGEPAAAERAARTLIERDRFRESAHGLLIRALAAQGNVAAALRAFDDLRVLLRDELGVSPSGPLRALRERLLAGEAVDPASGPPAAQAPASGAGARGMAPALSEAPAPRSPLPAIAVAAAAGPIFGRDDVLARLDDLLEHSAAGAQSVALVAGEPGIGKTRLVAEVASRAWDRGMHVLLGRTDEHALASYGPFLEALRHVVLETPLDELATLVADQGPELVQLLPELRTRLPDLADPLPGDSEAQRLRLFEAVARFLARTAEPAGALLVLEDLHWADPSSIQLLGYLGRGRAPGLSLVLTYRETDLGADHELRTVIAGLVREPAVERVMLEGLDEGAVGSVIEALSDRAPEPGVARAVHEQTAGNPFFVTEVVRRGAGPDEPAIPEGVRDVVAERVRRLGPTAATLLNSGAVCGREFHVDVAAQVGGVEYPEAVEALEDALGAGLVREVESVPGRVAFAHALVRETLYDRLSATRRVDMHRIAAEALEAAGGGGELAVELAYHYGEAVRGRERSDRALAERARDWLEAAGDAAVAVHSSQDALGRFERARELAFAAGAGNGALSRLSEKAGDVLVRLGRFDAAHERWEEALGTAPDDEVPERIADLRRKLGDVLVENGYLGAAIDQYKAGIALCGSEPSAAVARLYGESAWLYLARGDHMLAVYAAERAVGVTARLGEPRAASRAHAIFGRVFGRLGDPARAREQLGRAIDLARQADPFEELRALRSLADHVDGAESRSEEAADLYEQALELARRIGDVPAQLDVRAALGQLAVERADWATAERLADESVRVVEREGLTDRAALPLALAGALAWRAGELDAAEAQLAAAVDTATRIRWWRVAQLANWWLGGAVMRERDRLTEAATLLEEAAACGERAGYVERSVEVHAERAGLLAAAGDVGAAQDAAAEAAQAAARAASPAARAASDEAAAAALDDATEARGGLIAASSAWGDMGRPLAAARCLLVAAQRAERAGSTGAGDALERAIAAYTAAGVSSARARAAAL